ncbi:type I 3-dehydroquinate dehydratase [Lapidilactobacillus luobeiensis]|uniref:type I 3-dehydroquinate dehydratase n=1 Tax=Lapidilactobacillus luobeiensis TaxID=2950371 RepID=UPI0021C3338C|nr:type I 3-dehydroquinate dehydratase [Lapidilactobacillus luobeiensis]
MMTIQASDSGIAVALTARDLVALQQQLRRLNEFCPQHELLIEWRLDQWHDLTDWAELQQGNRLIRAASRSPLLITWRTEHARQQPLGATVYQAQMSQFMTRLSADLWDLEIARVSHPEELRRLLSQDEQIVWSQHFWQPQSRARLLAALTAASTFAGPTDFLKLATWAASSEDCLNLLEATWWAHQQLKQPLITMAMGPTGRISRSLGYLFGSRWSFGALTQQGSAPGQLPLAQLDQQLLALE